MRVTSFHSASHGFFAITYLTSVSPFQRPGPWCITWPEPYAGSPKSRNPGQYHVVSGFAFEDWLTPSLESNLTMRDTDCKHKTTPSYHLSTPTCWRATTRNNFKQIVVALLQFPTQPHHAQMSVLGSSAFVHVVAVLGSQEWVRSPLLVSFLVDATPSWYDGGFPWQPLNSPPISNRLS